MNFKAYAESIRATVLAVASDERLSLEERTADDAARSKAVARARELWEELDRFSPHTPMRAVRMRARIDDAFASENPAARIFFSDWCALSLALAARLEAVAE